MKTKDIFRTKVDPMKSSGWSPTAVAIVGTIVVMIILPICLVFLYAVSTKWYQTSWWWPQEVGTKWLLSIFETENLRNALVNSYSIAFLTTLATLAITFPASYVLGTKERYNTGWPATVIETFSNFPLAFPTITLALGLMPLFQALGLMSSYPGIVLCHMIMSIPYAMRAMVGSFIMIPPEYEEAARNLGASRLYVMRVIYLPLVWRGMLAASIFAFSWSLNEFVLVMLLGFPEIETIPVQIYQFVGGYYLHPQKAAMLGLFLLIPALGLMYIVERLLKGSAVVPAGA